MRGVSKRSVAVEPQTEQDMGHVRGFPLEFLAGPNPYQQIARTPLPIRLLFESQPLKDVRVETKSLNGPEAILMARTDANGYVSFRSASSGA